MPQLVCDKKLTFIGDQLLIDRIEALALIEGVSTDAWLRRLVDDKIKMGSRHMGSDHIDLYAINEVRPEVLAIIEQLATSITNPLGKKAELALQKLTKR